MPKWIYRFLTMVIGITYLFTSIPSYAADNTLTAKYENGKYVLDMEMNQFFDIDNLEFDRTYTKTLRFDNTSGKTVKVGMVDVRNDLVDNRLYERSKLDIKIDGVEVYSGTMNEARWEQNVPSGKSILVEYSYSVPVLEHIPDNSWMKAEMQSTFVFVGEIAKTVSGGHSGSGGSSSDNSKTPSPKPDNTEKLDKDTTENQNDTERVIYTPDYIVKIPDTGDHSPVELYFLVILLSGAGAIILFFTGKRQKKE